MFLISRSKSTLVMSSPFTRARTAGNSAGIGLEGAGAAGAEVWPA